MRRSSVLPLAWSVAIALTAGLSRADDRAPSKPGDTPDLAVRAWAVAEAVLSQHVEPPARQQMLLGGLRGAYKAVGKAAPRGLALRASSLGGAGELEALITEIRAGTEDKVPSDEFAQAVIEGLLSAVPGPAELLRAKEEEVHSRASENLYVGIHVALGTNAKEKRFEFVEVLENGPADRAGIKKGDVLESVEGQPSTGKTLAALIDRLRGPEGTSVTVGVRTPSSKDVRSVTMRRGRLPRTTVAGVRKGPDGGWEVCLGDKGAGRVGYVKVKEISGSTTPELRALARRLEEEGARSIILDLRGVQEATLHSTVLLADELLDGGTIGRVRWADRVETFRAEPEGLFPGRSLAVLIDDTTGAEAAWLAAALQDNHRALVVGQSPPPLAGVRSSLPILGGAYYLHLTTGTFERPDGRAMGVPFPRPYKLSGVQVLVMGPDGEARRSPSFGVTPDVVVGGTSAGQPDDRKSKPGTQPAAGPDADPVVIRAIEGLRERPKAS